MTVMTDKQAYAAMFFFLDHLWECTREDYLAGLLGSMSLLADGSTADPAIQHEWQEAVKCALNGGEAGMLELRK